MTSWKSMLGLGAACAACCAVPLFGVAGALGGLAAFGSALWACAGDFVPAALALAALATVWIGVRWRQRRHARSRAACDCADACAVSADRAGCGG